MFPVQEQRVLAWDLTKSMFFYLSLTSTSDFGAFGV